MVLGIADKVVYVSDDPALRLPLVRPCEAARLVIIRRSRLVADRGLWAMVNRTDILRLDLRSPDLLAWRKRRDRGADREYLGAHARRHAQLIPRRSRSWREWQVNWNNRRMMPHQQQLPRLMMMRGPGRTSAVYHRHYSGGSVALRAACVTGKKPPGARESRACDAEVARSELPLNNPNLEIRDSIIVPANEGSVGYSDDM